MQVREKQTEFGLCPLGKHLDGSVHAVAHPARQPEPPRLVDGRGAIPHAVHASVRDSVKATFLQFLYWHHGVSPGEQRRDLTTASTEGTETREFRIQDPITPSFPGSAPSVLSDLKLPRPAQRGEVAERSEAGEGLSRFMAEGSGPPPGGETVGRIRIPLGAKAALR